METYEFYIPNSKELQIATALIGFSDQDLQYIAFSRLKEEELLILLSICLSDSLPEDTEKKTKELIHTIAQEKKYPLLIRALRIMEEGTYEVEFGN